MLKKNKKIILISIVVFLIFITVIFQQQIKSGIRFLNGLLLNKNIELKKSGDNSINILLLGIGGGNHDGPNLTDTIIFANVNITKNEVKLISLPRDLWIDSQSEKINSIYAMEEDRKKGSGMSLIENVVEKITNQKIDYTVIIDFEAFTETVDLLGGIDIEVDRTFDDYEYPVEEERESLCGHTLDDATSLIATLSATIVFPCRYQHVHFDQGMTSMNGEKALIFVRSRHAEGEEGTDFARSLRQQKILLALKQQMVSLGIFLNPVKVYGIYDTVKNNIKTNINTEELDDFIKLADKMKNAKIESYVIDTGDEEKGREGLLINPSITEEYGFQWVLVPKKGKNDYSQIQSYINCVITLYNCKIIDDGKDSSSY